MIKAGIVGTGYAANQRAQVLQTDERSRLVVFSGHTPEKTQEFAHTHNTSAVDSWQQVVKHPEVDLVFVCTVNRDHGAIVRAALEAGKHIVVEYPISLDPSEAESLIALARSKGKLLHVEHIELLGGLHQALRQSLSETGNAVYARYITIVPKHPAPKRWTYHRELFGFPFKAALPHIHRFTNLFGKVAAVSCQTRFWGDGEYYTACLCSGQFRFVNGLIAEVTYAKGEGFWQGLRNFEVHGDKGTLVFESEEGTLIREEERIPIAVAGKRGLFVKDTTMVLDYLATGTPLYVSPEESLYALKVGEAARQSAETGETVTLE
ncbi:MULTISPECIES: Gfo/Idh/MocA family protein [unclassified Coleofasciculus]|uniref:Gfo/Idh/MocA family protein n=1 Tax=unclassified Coleofasciculus TaxID=2692782 RepID=UPI001882E43E|nr:MULTISPECIES: Gfo/Idh/MocA family oxidoreductase [unclassified Coleofasciculus]MBE9129358.1 Gfo/Idh/MocA family oxidoreductase [Coleofasciculus sp. LEGE 07081]MBE9152001.1 Gfo/Idh/MocA family oxidoreductase [Coleofasciculus sp. LEGE 07092]